ncbi:hypothetical protein [Rummeliibacillus pycnus]|uniref:hypothetical protein n=1 Tax=Rummeliibacillus pycnus TaxID=101070 RepID=UPI0037C5EF26
MGIGPFVSLFMLIIYITPIVFVIWFMVTMVKLQKENNRILQSIDEKLNRKY